jgi:hypothetical protein
VLVAVPEPDDRSLHPSEHQYHDWIAGAGLILLRSTTAAIKTVTRFRPYRT